MGLVIILRLFLGIFLLPRSDCTNNNDTFLRPSLFPGIPPTIRFSHKITSGNIPNEIRKHLLWFPPGSRDRANVLQAISGSGKILYINSIYNSRMLGVTHSSHRKFERLKRVDALARWILGANGGRHKLSIS
jgi:hypothetical protein